MNEEPYILGPIKPVKATWQEDPRFQDSSSEGDDEPETSEIEKDQEMFLSLPHTESARVFFFSKDDERPRDNCLISVWTSGAYQNNSHWTSCLDISDPPFRGPKVIL
ncbi:nucleolar protein 8-like isoform X2 [Corvus hawaiiensis]|uniref:nucleolar protein 8-like isoform X2 n=1 Tax=Corvus hawaiiensis TaxID=134902 RepID=UPI0020189BF3|nr:nucleolar protein 8-like isoform X2 [Corvus hawaiiensis]